MKQRLVKAGLIFLSNQRQILKEVVDKIVIDGNDVTIYGIIPLPEDKDGDVSVAYQSS